MAPDEKGGPLDCDSARTDHQFAPEVPGRASTDFTGGGVGRGDDERRERKLRRYLNICCGDSQGWLHVAVGLEPFINAREITGTGRFVPLWPSHKTVSDVLASRGDSLTPSQRFIIAYSTDHGDQDGSVMNWTAE